MPALAPVVDSLDKVPEAARGFYEPKDGKHVLILDGSPAGFVPAADLATANGKIVEFRDTNIALLKENGELKPLAEQFKGIDPVAAKAAIAKVADLGKKGVKDVDDIAALVLSAVTAAVAPLQQKLEANETQTAAERKRADDLTLRTTIGDKFLKAGGKQGAVDYIVSKAAEAFKVDAGKVAALPNQFSADKPGTALGIDEWITRATKEHDFAFEPSGGSGAAGSKGVGADPRRAGQQVLTDPTPKQLGQFGKEIAAGKMRVEYTNS